VNYPRAVKQGKKFSERENARKKISSTHAKNLYILVTKENSMKPPQYASEALARGLLVG
jgi:hypothetical protein